MRDWRLERCLARRLTGALLLVCCAAAIGGPAEGPLQAQPGAMDTSQPQDPTLLRLGQDLHDNLERARSAIVGREPSLLRVCLQEMRQDLTLLGLPADQEAIEEARPDASRMLGEAAGAGQWVPIRVEIEDETPDRRPARIKLGWLPLDIVSGSVEQALSAADAQQPDWQGALGAVDAALDAIRWESVSDDEGDTD